MSKLKLSSPNSQRATIRVSIPLKVALNEDLMKKSLTDLADHIGCRACFSGVDCVFQLQRDFVIDEKYAIRNVADGDPDGSPARKFNSKFDNSELVTARLSDKETMSIDSIYAISNEIINLRKGCPACHSGFDFLFKTEIESLRQTLS